MLTSSKRRTHTHQQQLANRLTPDHPYAHVEQKTGGGGRVGADIRQRAYFAIKASIRRRNKIDKS
jgi:hypothetical protein